MSPEPLIAWPRRGCSEPSEAAKVLGFFYGSLKDVRASALPTLCVPVRPGRKERCAPDRAILTLSLSLSLSLPPPTPTFPRRRYPAFAHCRSASLDGEQHVLDAFSVRRGEAQEPCGERPLPAASEAGTDCRNSHAAVQEIKEDPSMRKPRETRW